MRRRKIYLVLICLLSALSIYVSISAYVNYKRLYDILPREYTNKMFIMIMYVSIISLNGIFAVVFNWNLLRNKNEILETDLLDEQEGNLKLKLGWKFNTYFIFSLLILIFGLYSITNLLINFIESGNQNIAQIPYLIHLTLIALAITFLYDCFKIKRSFNSGQIFVEDQTKPTNVNRNPNLSKKSDNPITSRSNPTTATNQNVLSEISDNQQTEKSLLAENKISKREEYRLEFTKYTTNGEIDHFCKRNGPEHELNYLGIFLPSLYVAEIDSFIVEIEAAQNDLDFDEFPRYDGYAHFEVQISPPNFLLGTSGSTMAEIPLEDMRLLLLEWKEFKQS